MGASNVKNVYSRWSDLPHRPFRLLVHMAVMSLDAPRPNQAARVYWAGRDELARAIGYTDPGPTQYREVRYDLAALIAAGAVQVISTGRAGRRTEYRLTLTRTGGGRAPATGGGRAPATGGGRAPATGGGRAPAQGTTEEQLQEQLQEESRVLTFNTKRRLRNASDPDGLDLITHANTQ